MAICPNCGGRKSFPALAPILGDEPCPSCRQTGQVSENRRDWVKCPKCNGFGWVGRRAARETCPQCIGLGIVPPDPGGKSPYRRIADVPPERKIIDTTGDKGVITGRNA